MMGEDHAKVVGPMHYCWGQEVGLEVGVLNIKITEGLLLLRSREWP